MSFLRPDAVKKFEKLQKFLLWFQMAYAIWQFVRTAKFLRLPYVMVSSCWHGLDSWIKTRKILLMQEDLDVDKDPLPSDSEAFAALPKGMTVVDIGDHNVEVSFTDLSPPYTCLTTRHRAAHMKKLREFSLGLAQLQFGRDDDLLWPGAHLIRRMTFEEALNHVLSGNGYKVEPKVFSFFDYSAKELLNQNFVRFASIWPLILQARRYDFWSIVFSLVIILMDLCSYAANIVWRIVQYWVSRFVKWIILQVKDRTSKRFWFTFMGSISTRFECANFVTEMASSKSVPYILLATHTKFNKRNIDCTLEPVAIDNTIIVVSRTAPATGPSRSQRIPFEIGGVTYSALAQPSFSSEEGSSTVQFIVQDIKVENWNVGDMEYFLQVCHYCDQLRVSPVKALEGKNNNAMCCSFQEVVEGVKTRGFVVCKFRRPQRFFFT